MHKDIPANRQSAFHRRWLSSLPLLGLVTFVALGLACNRAQDESPTALYDPDEIFQQMSVKLAQAKALSFSVNRKLDAALVEGRNVAEDAKLEISVSRPNKFLVNSDSKDNARQVFFDGQNLSIYDATMKLYATVPVPGTIDEVVSKIDEKYGFTPPLAEFILSDPYRALSQQIKSKTYKGKENVGGVECHYLTLSSDVADSDVWIGIADSLPRKLVATFKNRDGNPKLEANFSNWNLAPSLDDKLFSFAAPKDAEQVEMVTEAKMQEIAAKEDAPAETTQKAGKPTGSKK